MEISGKQKWTAKPNEHNVLCNGWSESITTSRVILACVHTLSPYMARTRDIAATEALISYLLPSLSILRRR